ncbi:MAG: DMT family transporter [Flavobacteriaceae bacterium]
MKYRPSQFYSGALIALVAISLFSAKAVMVKLAYRYEVDHLTLLLLRMVFAFPFYVAIAFLYKGQHRGKIGPKDYFWLILLGFFGYYLASLFDFIGLQYIKAGLERIILFVYPTIVVLLNKWIFKQPISSQQWWAIGITYLGVVITFYPEAQFFGESVYKGGAFVFLSALCFALYIAGSGQLIPRFGVVRFTAYGMMASTFFVVAHYLIKGDGQALNQPMEVYGLGIAMAVLATLVPSFMTSEAIKRLGSSTYSIFGGWGPVSTILLAFFLLDERIGWVQWLGMGVVISGIAILSKRRDIGH